MEFTEWLSMTSLSVAIQGNAYWLWPTCESVHFIGLSMLVGATGLFDFRLMGFLKRIPLKAAWDLMPWAIAGFVMNLITGLIFLIGEPVQYYTNTVWWCKVAFLILAGVNALVFHFTMAAKIDGIEAGDDTPASFKVIGAVSLITWFGVLYFGRMLPFISASVSGGL